MIKGMSNVAPLTNTSFQATNALPREASAQEPAPADMASAAHVSSGQRFLVQNVHLASSLRSSFQELRGQRRREQHLLRVGRRRGRPVLHESLQREYHKATPAPARVNMFVVTDSALSNTGQHQHLPAEVGKFPRKRQCKFCMNGAVQVGL